MSTNGDKVDQKRHHWEVFRASVMTPQDLVTNCLSTPGVSCHRWDGRAG